ncbi:Na/Pi cotransporter family protein [Actibacterium pelagium]|uniref:Na/Pi cotransporter n=1 Tax=Actibacterium pelagium TaxID=2029103 RepID=A0A917ANP8_9RHOB|nr:Na/Pi cotransporter family protein [Actibacterium pelagium]GGE61834.1 Na/Pi cotransporter [Actibacterium pelagium]
MITELNHLELSTGLIGGLALFLFGMDIMTRALKQVAGASMKSILARMTGNRFLGMSAGAIVTAIIQSSSITTVLLVGFVSAGLMTSAQSVAVILGANIGTTITAQILAFKVTALALPVLSVGFFVSFVAKNKVTREYGRILLGVGMVFFGMAIMSDAMKPLRDFQPFLNFMLSLESVFLAALVGAGFTALVQSSSATTGILIVMAGQGLIGLEPAVALALGANIGTCVTALLAAIGKRREAVRVALVHTIFNVAGVLIWIGFVEELAGFARHISIGAEAGEVSLPRQIANVHTFFNIVNAFLFIGFTKQINRFVEWLVPERLEKPEPGFAPKHLDPKFLDVPAIAIDAVRLEILHLGQLLRNLLSTAIPTVTTGSPLEIDELRVLDRPVDLLHREIVGYMRQISLRSLPAEESDLLIGLVKIANDMEHIGDLVATGMVTSARKRLDEEVVISPTTAGVIAGLHREVVESLDGVLLSLETQDPEVAADVRKMKADFSELVEGIASHEIERLRADEPKRLHTYTREIELTETLDDIFKIIRRIARTEMAILQKPGS